MTLTNCLKRMVHFRELGREGEALAWESRAIQRGWIKPRGNPVKDKLVPIRDKK